MATADALLRKRDYLGLLAVSNRHGEAIARVVQKMLDFTTKNPSADFQQVREIAETEGTRVASSLNNRVILLADIGMIAPMLGLLGTVFGIIKSFGALGAELGTARYTQLSSGVSQALVNTAAGLAIGIPAMMFYAFFRGRVQKIISELESAVTHVLALLSLALHAGGVPTSVRDVAERTGLPQPYLEQILLALKGAGLVRSKRGVGGGYVLARDPEEITLSEIVSAVDGPIVAGDFGEPHQNGACDHEGQCVLLALWADVGEHMRQHLLSFTLADIAARAQGLRRPLDALT